MKMKFINQITNEHNQSKKIDYHYHMKYSRINILTTTHPELEGSGRTNFSINDCNLKDNNMKTKDAHTSKSNMKSNE